MIKHEIKTCPHCQKNFECKCGDIINCQCNLVELRQQHRDYIFKQYDDCLCAQCLIQLRDECSNKSAFIDNQNKVIDNN